MVDADEKGDERVLSVATERFERRLAEEMAGMRVETGREFAAVRREMAEEFAAVRNEMAQGFAAMRVEMHQGIAVLRQEMAGMRVELLKWSFLFWVGQVAAVAGLLAFMLRASGR